MYIVLLLPRNTGLDLGPYLMMVVVSVPGRRLVCLGFAAVPFWRRLPSYHDMNYDMAIYMHKYHLLSPSAVSVSVFLFMGACLCPSRAENYVDTSKE
jgi:hypothetical protein